MDMVERPQLLTGTIQRSRGHYHILGEDGVVYVANGMDWHNLHLDYQVGEPRFLIGKSVQFVPSSRRNSKGVTYADNIVVPLDASLAAEQRTTTEMKALARDANPHYIHPEERTE